MTKTMKIIISSVVILVIALGGGLVYRHEKQLAMNKGHVAIQSGQLPEVSEQ